MGRMGQESDFKTQLVLEICSISTRSVVCVHRLPSNPAKEPFTDWYCILGVEEDAGVNTIHKRYHKLALQLHPDKNKHPKAETAFKLVSEAYTLLSDAAKRKAFNLERDKNFCFECNRTSYTRGNVPGNSNGSILKAWNNISRSRSYKLWRNIREMRERLKEEAKVIENCLLSNSMSKKEIPVFNPSNEGYPHLRSHVYNNSETCWYLRTENVVHNDKGKVKHGSPVFEVKSQRSVFTNKFARVPSHC